MSLEFGIGSIIRVFESYSNRLLAILIILATVVAEGVVELSVYRCPCEPTLRKQYAIPFLIIPIFLLLMAGIAFNQKTRKAFQTTTCSRFCLGKYLDIFGFASIAPSVWIVLILLDGDYVACAATSVAYEDIPDQTCLPNETPFTEEYRNHKRESQTAGWIVAGIFGAIAFITHCTVQHKCSSMTEDEKKFRSECEQIVDEALVKACRRHAHEAAMASITSNDHISPEVDSINFWKTNCKKFKAKKKFVVVTTMEKFLANPNEADVNDQQGQDPTPSNGTHSRSENSRSTQNIYLELTEKSSGTSSLLNAIEISSTSTQTLLSMNDRCGESLL